MAQDSPSSQPPCAPGQSVAPPAGAAARRDPAATLRTAAIDFIPNPSFNLCPATAPHVARQLVDHPPAAIAAATSPPPATDEPAYNLPPHLSRMCRSDLLTAEEETLLFQRMNYLKCLADQLRETLDWDAPDPQTVELALQLLDQARAIRDCLLAANMRLVISIVKKFVTPCQSFDELLSEGTLTLMQAVEKFDYDRGFRFSTYAYRSICRTAYRFVASARQEEARLTRDADDWAFEQPASPSASRVSDQLWQGLREFTRSMLERLDRRERLIIRSRFALGSHRRVRSFQDLANRLGVSKERVRQIEARAIGKLQHMAQECDADELRFT